MTPRFACPMLCIILAAHTSQFATYKGIPDPDLPPPGAQIMATRDAPRWQGINAPNYFDSEDPTLQVPVRLPLNYAPGVTGAAYT
ncbi:hypothetical protein ACIBPB_23340 [Micromonospora sp. NPDC049836]|uniref:hypothetical protein n=1 Tax=Micromonospora sp. NPDC049836 TaxID=3364274 RepID=UPI0037AB7B32